MDDKENLFKEFPENSEAEWLEKVEKDLKGRALEELDWAISEDMKIAPFYHSNNQKINVPNNKTNSNTWEIGEDIFANDPKTANQHLLYALEAGVNAPRFILNTVWKKSDFAILFENVNPDYISTHFLIKKGPALSVLESFYNYLLINKINQKKIKGSINYSAENQIVELTTFSIENLPNFKPHTIKVEAAETASISKSLARAISKGNDYLIKLGSNKIAPEIANKHLQFSISVGTSYFPGNRKNPGFKNPLGKCFEST